MNWILLKTSCSDKTVVVYKSPWEPWCFLCSQSNIVTAVEANLS